MLNENACKALSTGLNKVIDIIFRNRLTNENVTLKSQELNESGEKSVSIK
jgi:hypothetical protein